MVLIYISSFAGEAGSVNIGRKLKVYTPQYVPEKVRKSANSSEKHRQQARSVIGAFAKM